MSLNSGALRHRVLIEQLVDPTDSDGDVVQDPVTGQVAREWEQFGNPAWVKIAPLSAREFFESRAKQSVITTKITMRYRAGVTAGMRVNHSGVLYNIEGVMPDPDSGRESMLLLCGTGASQGE